MLRKLANSLSYSNVVATIALFMAIGGGTAVALKGKGKVDRNDLRAKVVNTRNIADSAVDTLQLASGAVTSTKLGTNAVTEPKIADNAVDSNELSDGGVNFADLSGFARGARAYGRVNQAGTGARLKNATVAHSGATGSYCITPTASSGISVGSSVLLATPDFSQDDTDSGANDNAAHAEWNADGTNCPAGSFEVITFTLDVDGADVFDADQGFSFVIP